MRVAVRLWHGHCSTNRLRIGRGLDTHKGCTRDAASLHDGDVMLGPSIIRYGVVANITASHLVCAVARGSIPRVGKRFFVPFFGLGSTGNDCQVSFYAPFLRMLSIGKAKIHVIETQSGRPPSIMRSHTHPSAAMRARSGRRAGCARSSSDCSQCGTARSARDALASPTPAPRRVLSGPLG
jgi:hypothetical protein